MPGLSPDRADIIVAGLAIVDRVMDRFEVNTVQVHNRGVRDGLLLTMIDQSLGPPVEKPARSRCGHRAVGRQLRLRDGPRPAGGPAGRLDLRAIGRRPTSSIRWTCGLLEAAAQLQDVGYLINYDQHHKHSYHLILHSRLEGFQPHELELIANVARYHRGADPKRKHANFRQLSPRDQQRVRQMAADSARGRRLGPQQHAASAAT